MNCANHPQAVATAYCRTCGKPLCGQCQHNVRGVIYCEDCLATRLGDAAPPQSSADPVIAPGIAPRTARVPDAPSPGLAAFLGFIPGVGAMYNGQFGKAIAHLMVFIGLIWATDTAGRMDWVFGMLIPFWIFYMVFDAYRTAHARELGLPAPTDPFGFETWWMSDSARAAQQQATANSASASGGAPILDSGGGRAVPTGAVALIAIGAIFLLVNMGIFPYWRVHEFWPVFLIGLGVWLFVRRRSSTACSCQRCQARCLMGPAVLVTLGTLFLLDSIGRVPFWRSFPILLIVMGAVLIMRRSASDQGHISAPTPPAVPPAVPPAPPATPQSSAPPADGGTEVHNG